MIPPLMSLLDPDPPTKAYLIAETDASVWGLVELQFNPDRLTISRSVEWRAGGGGCGGGGAKGGRGYQPLGYNGSRYDQMKVRVILDTTIPSDPLGLGAAATQAALMVPGTQPGPWLDLLLKSGPESVLTTINTLVDWTFPVMKAGDQQKGKTGRPPAVGFIWGEGIQFYGAIKDLSFNLTLFDSDGTPVRAEGDVTLVGRRAGPSHVKVTDLDALFNDPMELPDTLDTSTLAATNFTSPSLF